MSQPVNSMAGSAVCKPGIPASPLQSVRNMQSATKPARQAPRSDVYTIVAVLPFVVVCIIAAYLAAEQGRTAALSEVRARARTGITAVDSELRGHILTVQAMATSRGFAKGDVRELYEEARRVLPSQPGWLNIGLLSSTGTQLFNAVLPFGAPPGVQVDQDSLERALELATPQIGNVAIGPAIDRAATRVRVPVVADGKVRFVVSVPLRPQLYEELLRDTRLPDGWDIALVDGNKRLIAAVPPQAARHFEEHHADAIRKVEARVPQGVVQTRRADGTEVYTSYVTSELSGWTVNVSVPKDLVDGAAWKGVTPIVVGLMAALVVAAVMVWLAGRR